MTDDNKLEDGPADEQRPQRRAYQPPSVSDFLQPLVVLGSSAFPVTGICAANRIPPKH